MNAMRNPSLMLVSLLRRFPRTRAFDKHLTDCAAYEAVDRAFDSALRPLKTAHVLSPVAFRSLDPCLSQEEVERADVAEASDNVVSFRGRRNPKVIDGAHSLNGRCKSPA